MKLEKIHHIALIVSDYEKSKNFYVEVLGLDVIKEVYRKEKQSMKLDLGLNGEYVIELFSFPDSPARVTQPEACGLRHLAFAVENLDKTVLEMKDYGVVCEEIRVDTETQKRFTFCKDPDGLPIEFYES